MRPRLLVRGYKTEASGIDALHLANGQLDERYYIDSSVVRDPVGEHAVRVGDTMMLIGQTALMDEVTLWAPVRVVALGPRITKFRKVWAVGDDKLGGEHGILCRPKSQLEEAVFACVALLADEGRPAQPSERAALLSAFDL